MKVVISTMALIGFAGAAAATSDQDVYAGFARNPDLSHDMTYMKSPSVTTRGDIYRGFEQGNPDL